MTIAETEEMRRLLDENRTVHATLRMREHELADLRTWAIENAVEGFEDEDGNDWPCVPLNMLVRQIDHPAIVITEPSEEESNG